MFPAPTIVVAIYLAALALAGMAIDSARVRMAAYVVKEPTLSLLLRIAANLDDDCV